MKLEDYSKYYIQGSDHYLVPKDIFVELFNEMINWKQENEELKSQLKGTTHCYDEEEHRQLKKQLSSITLQLEKLEENFRATNKGLQKVRLKRKKWKHRYELARCEIKELKKQLEEYKDKINWYENFEVNKTIDKLRLKHNIQEKEFIKWLEDEIENSTFLKPSLKMILQKYREIVNGDDK